MYELVYWIPPAISVLRFMTHFSLIPWAEGALIFILHVCTREKKKTADKRVAAFDRNKLQICNRRLLLAKKPVPRCEDLNQGIDLSRGIKPFVAELASGFFFFYDWAVSDKCVNYVKADRTG